MLHYQEATCEWSVLTMSSIQCQVFNRHSIYYVISKEQLVSGGGGVSNSRYNVRDG